jgi:uncharacterized membrane protein
VAALAYLLLPVSGIAAYLTSRSSRVRFHGLQAVALGLAWPAALYACTYLSPGATQVCALLGGTTWLGFLLTAAFGLDPRLPVVGRYLQRAAAEDPRSIAERRGGSEATRVGGGEEIG